MPVRRVTYYRVSLGGTHKYFSEEDDAKSYAKDRAADPENWDGIPFLDEITDRELLVRLNELERANE